MVLSIASSLPQFVSGTIYWWRVGLSEVATLVSDSLARARLVRVRLESRVACGECGPVWL